MHKGNALNGARIQLENTEPFGRDMRGVSHVFVTKDRPGYLRTKGRADQDAGQDLHGHPGRGRRARVLAVHDDAVRAEGRRSPPAADDLANNIHRLIWEETDHKVGSLRALGAMVRLAGKRVSHAKVRDARR